MLVIKEVSDTGVKRVDYNVHERLLVQDVVVTSFFLEFEQNEKNRTTQPLKRKNQQPQLLEKTKLHHPLHHLAYQDKSGQVPYGNTALMLQMLTLL